MKYFTPELFATLNSDDRNVVRKTSARWDQAVAEYKRHLKSIQRKLPSAVRRLAALYLHDAQFTDFKELAPRSCNPVAQLMLQFQFEHLAILSAQSQPKRPRRRKATA